ncbi:glycerol-3-phosphate dehydrogenase/oxidase [Peribacillus cavernae]|uniref:Glycerol-3-phosphate dehydrogenase n=1 Tax=Peribacillus cavernae TaxID=1674310 RepID=A0A433HKB2_9BACI|nr:glycerol-3-phosphate dehydrogenase/oxidase [Peribacillus cavernae]MDQ0219108.1 glycerol-3-phosphate dehydrogenase [Peribacillus cavernae]RUQ28659.1 glycerol-3-phosphate dehydrogenase/oxidase [Peribacillus cavernae]
MRFSNKNRSESINRMKQDTFDVIVIGGGITGAGIALDATVRGLKVALIEMQDFAAGTSSRSTKLVHGGLRYLKQFEFKMVAEVGKERAIVYENGPHVTAPEWMLLPIHKDGTFGKFSTGIGLRIYDFLAGVKRGERRKMLSTQETLKKEPLVKKAGLKGGGYYVEYRTDDARLTIEVIKSAVEKGALPMNYTKCEKLIYRNGQVRGVGVTDQLSGESYEVFGEKIINAAGPWVDSIREKDQSKVGKTLKLSKGVHIVIDQSRFPLKQSVYFDSPDKRMIFAIPRDGKTYVGTTDTFYNEDLTVPAMTKEDRDYLLKSIAYMFPNVKITEKDIESSWAGVRPLIHEEGKDPSEISRKDEIWESQSGLITIAGGKLTGYRKMAETVVNLVTEKLAKENGKAYPRCSTKQIPISGGNVGGSANFTEFTNNLIQMGVDSGLNPDEARQLLSIYGSNAPALFAIANNSRGRAASSSLPLGLFSKLQYALDYEMAATPVDFFFRRTGALLFNIHLVQKHKQSVIEYMADYFTWNKDTKLQRTEQLEREIRRSTSV